MPVDFPTITQGPGVRYTIGTVSYQLQPSTPRVPRDTSRRTRPMLLRLCQCQFRMQRLLNLSSAADMDGGFRLGQDTLRKRGSRDTGTLAMNSVSTRSKEQIHIHVCDHPGSTVRGILNKLHRDSFKTTSSVDLSALPWPSAAMSCRASPTRDEDINTGRDIVDWLKQYAGMTTCAQYDVGAGVLTDSDGHSWACITTGHRAAGNLFCSD
ncbi:hypothetical protein N7517_000321 [Penicillium concentricum]|uniref:Uncharacterized protein n=1 Tax=Penicillium concentricum TaxID=293559 RepID=A0A9W9SQR8_9EURO|nr:uncharacterized protein N7517_000321 [Penicillium concentricum]KAJ5382410.1 hypothetical protein N7517_000321 [Penicillium concentricum]